MSKPLKPRRGTTAENNAFVGEAYEVTYDTDKSTLVCRDGLTAGGFPLAKEEEVSSLDASLRALIAEEVAKCLKLTGGTMNGVIYNPTFMRNNLSGQIELYGGTTGSNGAYIALYGQSCTDGYGSGKLLLRAANKGTTTDVTIDPGKGMYVAGKEVLTSAGGTLTGGLTGTAYTQKLSSIDVTATPSESIYGEIIRFSDKNNKLFAMLQPVQWSNGNNALRFIVAKKDGTQGCALTVEQKKDGTSTLTWNGSTVSTLVSSWRSGANWYRKWSDGFIEQGGDYRNASDWGFNTITLHTAFATTDYFVVGQEWQYKWNSNDHKPNNMLKSKSTTSFSLETFNPGSLWYACGY